MTPRDRLLELARALEGAPSVTVPRAWLLEALEGAEADQGDTAGPVVDFTVGEIAARYRKAASTVRSWCERGVLPGAYRRAGREWRIPPEAVTAYEDARRRPRAIGAGGAVDMGDWRSVLKAG